MLAASGAKPSCFSQARRARRASAGSAAAIERRIRRVERGSEVIEQAGLVAGEIGHSRHHRSDIARTDVVEQG